MPPTNTFVQGMVGTGDRVTNIHPESWNPNPHKVLAWRKFPMMTFLDSMAKNAGGGKINSRIHNWWQEGYNAYYGTVTDVYTNASLATAYTSGGTAGQVLYFKIAATDAAQIRTGDNIVISNSTDNNLRVVSVTNVNIDSDSNSYFAGKLLMADTSNILAYSTLKWGLMGDAQAEGSELPTAISHDPQQYTNITQIFMESVEHSGSELEESERISGTKYARDKKNAMERFKMKQEWAYLFGYYNNTTTGANGKQKRHMRGAYWALKENESSNVIYAPTASGYTGTWLNYGLDMLKNVANDAATYSESDRKLVFAGNAAWKAINDAVEDRGWYKLETKQTEFGIRIRTLVGLTQDWDIIQSPTMSTRGFNNSIFVTEPNFLRKKVFRPLKYVKGRQADDDGYVFVDGKKEGWLEEATLEYVNMQAWRWIDGVGVDHT